MLIHCNKILNREQTFVKKYIRAHSYPIRFRIGNKKRALQQLEMLFDELFFKKQQSSSA